MFLKTKKLTISPYTKTSCMLMRTGDWIGISSRRRLNSSPPYTGVLDDELFDF